MSTPLERLPVLRRPVTLYEHSCCGSVRWSGARCCDRCGSPASFPVWNITLAQAMARLHSKDVAPHAPAHPSPARQPPPAAPEQPPPAPPATRLPAPQPRPQTTSIRPPGARPHRWDGVEEEASVPVPAARSVFASPGAAVGLPLTLIAALLVGASISTLTEPLIGIAAILLVLFVPLIVIAREEE